MPHLAYLSGLAPGDFYLFLIVKQKFESIQVIDSNHIFECLQEILDIDQAELNQTFHAWMQWI
jgi:hypothetical protein